MHARHKRPDTLTGTELDFGLENTRCSNPACPASHRLADNMNLLQTCHPDVGIIPAPVTRRTLRLLCAVCHGIACDVKLAEPVDPHQLRKTCGHGIFPYGVQYWRGGQLRISCFICERLIAILGVERPN